MGICVIRWIYMSTYMKTNQPKNILNNFVNIKYEMIMLKGIKSYEDNKKHYRVLYNLQLYSSIIY